MVSNLAFVRTFVTLAETGSFRDTASALNISQPTVSQHIKKLEDSLGVSLFTRSNTLCSTTLQGETLLPYAHSLLTSAERFSAAAKGDHISIGCSGNIANYYIASGLQKYIEHNPDSLTWNISVATNPEIADKLEEGLIDIAIMEWPDERPSFKVRLWREEKLVVIVPPNHPLRKKKEISIEELTGLSLIGGEKGSGTGTLLRNTLGKASDQLKIAHNLHSTEAVKNAVQAGLGCSIVLKKTVEDEAALSLLGVLNLKEVELLKSFYVAYKKELPERSLPVILADFLCANTNTE
ncbi:MAG: LysR family transcriptional regulator [Methyloligellaceae bacterium]